MTIYDCVREAATLLGLDETAELLKEFASDVTTDALTGDRTVKLLTECCNLVVNEVASEYCKLLKTCHCKVRDNRLNYSDLEGSVIDILAVRKEGRSVKFKEYYSYLYVAEDGLIVVEYAYSPLDGTLGSETDYWGGRIGKRTLSYGIAAEYCIISGRIDEAGLWDKRYKDSLFNLSGLKREARLAKKRWV